MEKRLQMETVFYYYILLQLNTFVIYEKKQKKEG